MYREWVNPRHGGRSNQQRITYLPKKHLGDVYLNGLSFYEAPSLSGVSDPPLRSEAIDDWTGVADRIPHP